MMEDRYSRVSGKDILNAAAKELDRKQQGTINDDNVYMFDDDYSFSSFDDDDNIIVKNIEQLRSYVVNRIHSINLYVGDYIKEKALISVFKKIYEFSINPNFNDYDLETIDEIKDYIYDTCVYPPDRADEIAYLEITNKGKRK